MKDEDFNFWLGVFAITAAICLIVEYEVSRDINQFFDFVEGVAGEI